MGRFDENVDLLNELFISLITAKGLCRTAPATPGVLRFVTGFKNVIHLFYMVKVLGSQYKKKFGLYLVALYLLFL